MPRHPNKAYIGVGLINRFRAVFLMLNFKGREIVKKAKRKEVRKMFVKYWDSNCAWHMIDGVIKTSNKIVFPQALIKAYDNEVKSSEDDTTKLLGGRIPLSHKVYSKALEEPFLSAFVGEKAPICILDETGLERDKAFAIVVLELAKPIRDGVDYVLLVTNQTVFIMNDSGQTVERLL